MLERLKSMLFGTTTRERAAPDPIRAQVVIATQRNERASENARQALAELLERNDGLRGTRK